MAHDNRDKLTIDQSGDWQAFTHHAPQGMAMIGTVTRGNGEAGALALIERTGKYVQVNNGCIRNLDGRKVLAALGTKTGGRPVVLADSRNMLVRLDGASLDAATRLGEGNVSAGIRLALATR